MHDEVQAGVVERMMSGVMEGWVTVMHPMLDRWQSMARRRRHKRVTRSREEEAHSVVVEMRVKVNIAVMVDCSAVVAVVDYPMLHQSGSSLTMVMMLLLQGELQH